MLFLVASTYDVRTGTYSVVFNAGVNTITVKIPIKDDKLIEGTEAFGVQLIVPDHHIKNGLKLGKPSIATVLIKDGTYICFSYVCTYIHAHFCCTLTDDKPPTKPPATRPPATRPPATRPPATRPPATQPPATQPPATPCKIFVILSLL